MTAIKFIEIWCKSICKISEAINAKSHLELRSKEVFDHSVALNVRLPELGKELDFIAWESGNAELSLLYSGGQIEHVHIDNIDKPEVLGPTLDRITEFLFPDKLA